MSIEPRDDAPIAVGVASNAVVVRLLDGDYAYSAEIEERQREEAGTGGMVMVLVALSVVAVAAVIGAIAFGLAIGFIVDLAMRQVL